MNYDFRSSEIFQRLRKKAERIVRDKGDREWRLALVDVTARRQSEQALRESEERLRLAVEGARLGTWDRNLITGEVIWNHYLYALLGRDPEGPAITGETFFGYIHPEDIDRVRKHLATVLEDGTDFYIEFRIIREDGEVRWLAASGRVYRDANGEPVRMAGANYNITDQKKLAEELHDSEERLRMALRAGEMGVWERGADGSGAIWDRRMFELYGRDPEAPPPDLERLLEYIHEDDRARVKEKLENTLRTGNPIEEEFRIVLDNGEIRWIASFGIPMGRQEEGSGRITGLSFDITARRQAEEILRTARDELEARVRERTAELEKQHREVQRINRQLGAEIKRCKKFEAALKKQGEELATAYQKREFLAGKLVDLLESERRQIGSTLHDDIGQILTGATLHLDGMLRDRNGLDGEMTNRLEKVRELIRSGLKRTKKLAHNLRSDALERFGLIPALKELIGEMNEYFDDGIHFFVKNISGSCGDANSDLILYRVVQESLTNVMKHGKASEVFVNLNQKDKRITLSIEDNGVGFDYGIVSGNSGDREITLGLTIMRERVAQVGGTFYIESRPGWGTQVIAEIPI